MKEAFAVRLSGMELNFNSHYIGLHKSTVIRTRFCS